MVDQVQITTPEAGPIAPKEGDVAPAGSEGKGGERPAWLPEKFGSPEEMAKSYSELEKKLSGGDKANKSDESTQQKPAEGDKGNTESTEVSYGKAVDEALASADLKPSDVATEWAEKGELSDGTYEALQKAGFPKEVVDTYVKGFERAAAEGDKGAADADADSDNLIEEHFGGQEGFDRVADWARTNLSEDDLASYNKLVDEGSPEAARMATLTLKAWYEAAEGKLPNLVKGGAAATGGDGFASIQEMSRAMAEARRSGDPAQIKAVEHKALRSRY